MRAPVRWILGCILALAALAPGCARRETPAEAGFKPARFDQPFWLEFFLYRLMTHMASTMTAQLRLNQSPCR